VKKQARFHTGKLIDLTELLFFSKVILWQSKFYFCSSPICLRERTNLSFFILDWSSERRLKWKG